MKFSPAVLVVLVAQKSLHCSFIIPDMTLQLSCLLSAEIEEGNVCFGSMKTFLIRLYVGGVDAVEDASVSQLDSIVHGASFLSTEAARCPLTMGRSTFINVSVVVFALVKIREQRACKLCPEAGHSLHRNERAACSDSTLIWSMPT